MKRRIKSFLSLLFTAIILICQIEGLFLGSSAAEPSEKEKYKIGHVRILFEENSSTIQKMDVLCEKDTGKLWVDGEEFLGILPDYHYSYHEREGTVELTAFHKQVGFQVGSSESAYKVGDCECFYRMSQPVVEYKERIWIPADYFFSYLGCNVYPESVSPNTEGYLPRRDFLVVENPQYTVLDVLYDIFEIDNGLYWMFTYEKDFGVGEEKLEDLLNAAKIATGIYGTLTADFDTILSWASVPFSSALNGAIHLSNDLFGTKWRSLGSLYDGKNMRSFLTAMLNISEDQMNGISEDTQKSVDFAVSAAELITQLAEKQITAENARELTKLFQSMEADRLWPVFQENFDELYDNTVKVSDSLNTIGNGLKMFGICFAAAGTIQKAANHDKIMEKAMEYYVEDSKTDSILTEEARSALEIQFASLKGTAAAAISELAKQGYTGILPDLILEKAASSAAGTVGVVTTMNKLLWYLVEEADVLPLAKVSEPEALEMAMYGMLYETDAWRELAISYQDVALNNGLNSYEELKDCAYMAVNYLKACYVTREAAMESLKSADFASSDAYRSARTKNRRLAHMIQALTEAISLAEGSTVETDGNLRGYGVLLNASEFTSNELTYNLFLHPSYQKGNTYRYSEPSLMPVHYTIYPLVYFEGYYEFIRDELLPERGFADLTSAEKYLDYQTAIENRSWDVRRGLLGADIVDLNQDDTEDLLVYYYGSWQEENWPEEENCLIAELYTMDEDDEIYLVERQLLDRASCISLHYIFGGIMDLNGRYYLYTEYYGDAYFADGDGLEYNFYEFGTDGRFLPEWRIGKSDGGTSDIAYSIFTRIKGEEYDKLVLQADGGFRMWYPDMPVVFDKDIPVREALDYGFSKIGLEPSQDSMIINETRSSYIQSDSLTPSFCYLSVGELQNSGRFMKVTLEDYTSLKEEIEALEEGTISGRPGGSMSHLTGVEGIAEETEKSQLASEETILDTTEELPASDEPRSDETKKQLPTSDYLLPDAAERILDRSEVEILSLQEVCYAKNEMYARHGRCFLSKELQEYFGSKSWYAGTVAPENFSDAVFNSFERQNLMLLVEVEENLRPGGYLLDQPGYDITLAGKKQ